MAANHLKRKLRTYQALYHINRDFGSIRQQLNRLRHAGFLRLEKLEVFNGFALELQSQIRHDIADSMHAVEDDEMFEFGKVRIAREHYLNPDRPAFKDARFGPELLTTETPNGIAGKSTPAEVPPELSKVPAI